MFSYKMETQTFKCNHTEKRTFDVIISIELVALQNQSPKLIAHFYEVYSLRKDRQSCYLAQNIEQMSVSFT
jgi:hypothetical protein